MCSCLRDWRPRGDVAVLWRADIRSNVRPFGLSDVWNRYCWRCCFRMGRVVPSAATASPLTPQSCLDGNPVCMPPDKEGLERHGLDVLIPGSRSEVQRGEVGGDFGAKSGGRFLPGRSRSGSLEGQPYHSQETWEVEVTAESSELWEGERSGPTEMARCSERDPVVGGTRASWIRSAARRRIPR